MSMNDYPIKDKGLFLAPELIATMTLYRKDPDEAKASVQKILTKHQDIDIHAYTNFWETIDILQHNEVDVVTCAIFSGGIATLDLPWSDPGKKLHTRDNIQYYADDDRIGYIPFQKSPGLMGPEGYSCPEEILLEMETLLVPAFLPDNIDLRPYLVEIEGTYFA